MPNLFLRIITALLLLPIFVVTVFYGGILLKIILSIIAFLATVEISSLINNQSKKLKYLALIFCAVILLFSLFNSHIALLVPIISILIFTGLTTILSSHSQDKKELQELALLFLLLIYIFGGILSLYWLQASPNLISRNEAIALIYIACIFTWANDSFAYFGGNLFGKHIFFPTISQKKTLEGFFSGALLSLLLVFAIKPIAMFFSWEIFSYISYFDLAGVGLPSIIFAPLGDLVESKIKRIFQVKDSSNILPGHGGFLDRIDSLLIVLPWTACYALYIRPLFL